MPCRLHGRSTGTQAFADVYRSIRNADGSFGPPAPVVELNSPASEGRPYLSHSGMEIYFQSNRPGGQGGFDLWVATRASVFDAWSPPEPVLELATAGNELTPVLSWDGLTLSFAVNRPGEAGQIYEARRERLHGTP